MAPPIPKRLDEKEPIKLQLSKNSQLEPIETPNVFLMDAMAALTTLTFSATIAAPSRTVERMNHFQPGCEEKRG